MFATVLTLTIDATAAGIIGTASAGAITFVGKSFIGWLNSRAAAEDELRKERNALLERMFALTTTSATSIASGAKTLESVEDRLAALERSIGDFRNRTT